MDTKGLILTAQGHDLMKRSLTGTRIQFSHAEYGAGVYPDDVKFDELTGLVDSKLSLPFQAIKNDGNGTAVLTVVFTNSGVAEGFVHTETGIYADDPVHGKILYAVHYVSNGGYIPPGESAYIVEDVIDYYLIVGQSDNVSATINNMVVLATKTDITSHDDDPSAHAAMLTAFSSSAPVLTYTASGYESNDIAIKIENYADYMSGVEFGLAPQAGAVVRSGDTIIWTLPHLDEAGDLKLEVSAREFGKIISTSTATVDVALIPFNVAGLGITSPAEGAVGVKETADVTAEIPVSSDPAYNHISTSWYVSPDGTKANAVAKSVDDAINLNSWKITKGMAEGTVYKLWREIKMSNGETVFTLVSDKVSFTSAEAFNVWRDYTATLDSQINSFLADLPYNLSMCKVSDTCFLTAFRLGSGLTLKCAALTRGSSEAVDFTAATPFDVSPVDVNNNGLSALVPMGSNHVLSFFDPDNNLDAAISCRLLAKGATEADWAVSGSGIPLSNYGYVGSIKAAEGSELGVPCIYHEERALNTSAAVVSEITRPTNTSNVLTKNELFVSAEGNPMETAIVGMSENEIIFAYSYGGPPFNVKLYSISRADSSSAWGAAQLITTYESLAQSAQYLELIRMSADRFVLSYYEGDLADDRVRGKVFNRVGGTWIAGNEFLTKEGNWAVRPVLASPNEETVVIVYGIDNAQAEVMVYDGTYWWTGDPVTVFDSSTGQKAMRVDSQNSLAFFFTKNLSPAAGNFKEMIAG